MACFGRLAGCLAVVLALLGVFSQVSAQSPEPLRLLTLDDTTIDPFAEFAGAHAVAFVFVSVECPISNRYAPEMKRLYDRFAAARSAAGGEGRGSGAAFWLVYPNPADSPDAIREHVKAYGYPMRALRDPDHVLVKRAGATITPEAAVYDAQRQLRYRGRIDDKYVAIGLERPNPTTRDLENALSAVAAGKPIAEARTQAVGCYIADFVHVHPQGN